ncbi:hypothetical protein [uncultured Gimesia sp.]|uniref:hypothetical protein n=1 Tax=uncultured Gimesia sp. TaxID=1678688 RepID=UPI0030D9D409|tara:strand:+ start:13840 stop:14166 length:327 start_codon:yes stop_codon:yes gene_type:complete
MMAYLIFFFLSLLWVTGSYGVYRCGLKAGGIGITAIVYFVFIASYVVGLFQNIGLYNTGQYSTWLLLTYLLVATMICFYLVLLSLITGSLIQTLKSREISSELRNARM